MKEGLLWYDDSGRDLETILALIARRHKAKYGREPTECHVHPDVIEEEDEINGIKIIPDSTILEGHWWIG